MRIAGGRVFIPIVFALGGAALIAQTAAQQAPPPQQTPQPQQAAPQGRGGGRGGGIQVQPGQPCPPGTTMTRPGNCQTPEFPAPSILDYHPRSTLVTDAHMVPKAKYPVIDLHGHPRALINTTQGVSTLIAAMDQLNLRVMIAADGVSGDRLKTAMTNLSQSEHKDRFRVFTGINFQNVGPGWAERVIAQLEADVKAGAIGIGEISKSFGLQTRKPDGSRLRVDDPALDPVWEACARLNIPVFIHTAEPQEFFQQPDYNNERWLELALYADRRNYQPGQVTFEQLMVERDNLFRKHPKTKFVAAHFGWHANDLKRAAKMLDEFPNVTTEVGAILYDIGRQPRAAHEFFVKYQDRILFGKDAWEPTEYPYYWRVFETKDEYFDYYRDYHAFWKLYGIDLPDAVLKKVYYQNALKLLPGLPRTGWPQ